MKRTLITATALLGVASAATFAGFSIQPAGDQKLNLQTGVTTLAQGGTATDAKNGLKVEAKFIEYKDGAYLKARTATLTTSAGGVLKADQANYDAPSAVLSATGNLKFNDKNVKDLTADAIQVDSKRRLVIARGNVKGGDPSMSANTVVVDYAGRRAVMYGNYKYTYGRTKLSNAQPNATLFVTWNAQGQPQATTRPAPDQLAPFQAYLK